MDAQDPIFGRGSRSIDFNGGPDAQLAEPGGSFVSVVLTACTAWVRVKFDVVLL
jgi:hypothetical protein